MKVSSLKKKLHLLLNPGSSVDPKAEIRSFMKILDTEENHALGLFDKDWYYSRYPDVKNKNMPASRHYLRFGHNEGRDPGPNFDNDFYKQFYPDVVAAQLNPLVHYLLAGRNEERAPNPRALKPSDVSEARHIIVKDIDVGPSTEVAILVTHAPAGRLKPHVCPFMDRFNSSGIAVMLVVVTDRPLELLPEEIEAASGIVVRENLGYDFGAWAHALRIEPALYGVATLILTNDSIVPAGNEDAFGKMVERIRQSSADVVGLTASHEYGWHISSYFIALKPKALGSWTFQHFMRDIRYLDDKDKIIRTYEVPFAARMKAGGLQVEALYTGRYSSNPTLFSWKELIQQGFPFIKLLLLRKQFLDSADWPEPIKRALTALRTEWRPQLKAAGFDVDLVQAAINASDYADVPLGGDSDLLVDGQRFEAIAQDHALRVAFFGPWNYDNGLGAASRELLCALRHTRARLNIYPITTSFHVHRQVAPPIAMVDFAGRPDLAIVHLNPDSWHLLTPAQRQVIRSAKQKIGYWVWETDTLPAAWNHNLHSVDRIWAPSTYCAEVFRRSVEVPVDVVPHPVRVPADTGRSGRHALLSRLGVDPQRRVILYIFDGASYLIRKNPEALIRAFASSGLERAGWTLLLKVKHLNDRPEAGKALADLAGSVPGTMLVDISLSADEVLQLLTAADIYASPHCSEGFGLTVAEAMAVGKPVVATDFGGTRDFLSSGTGYPVAWDPFTLEEDHGHYLEGHSWAKIDEDALGKALVKAARAVESGDSTIGSAARTEIERMLSYTSVAEAIEASFAEAIISSAVKAGIKRAPIKHAAATVPPIPDVRINPTAGTVLGRATLPEGVLALPVGDDLDWDGIPPPDGHPDDWLIIAPGNARLQPGAGHVLLQAAKARPDVGVFYADDAAVDVEPLERIRAKPDFNVTLLVSQDYIGAPVIMRRKTWLDLGGLRRDLGSAALYDLVLRAAQSGRTIARIPQVMLVHPRERPFAETARRIEALRDLDIMHDIDLVEGDIAGTLVQRRHFEGGFPPVTLLIPTNRTGRPGHDETYIERLLRRIAQTRWPQETITVIVGDNFEDEPEWARKAWPFHLVRVETPEHRGSGFNYAVKANRLWRLARDEHVVFLNDDAVPLDDDWLRALIGFSVDSNVGGVGAGLFYENGTIQHAGLVPAFRTVVHTWLNWPADAKTYMDWAYVQREWSMVTGAILATRRSILERVCGFDEKLTLEFNDVDLCLRIRNLGYRIVCNPDARFTHAEKASRGETAPPGAEVALFLSRWTAWLEHDPASHPAFDRQRFDLVPTHLENAWYAAR